MSLDAAGGGRVNRMYCSQPVLSMCIAKRKGETEREWGRRFDRQQVRFWHLMRLRNRLDGLAKGQGR